VLEKGQRGTGFGLAAPLFGAIFGLSVSVSRTQPLFVFTQFGKLHDLVERFTA
jgi:hypothetical protein